jgi:hypothetical protein
MSALPPKADISERYRHVRFVPKAEVAAIRSEELIVRPDAKSKVIFIRAHWLKVKNPDAPAVRREAGDDWGRHRIVASRHPGE